MDGTKHLELLALEARLMEIMPTALEEAKRAYLIWIELSNYARDYGAAAPYYSKAMSMLTAMGNDAYKIQDLWHLRYEEKRK